MIVPYSSPTIGLLDFAVLAFCELAFFWFFFPKHSIKQIFPVIVAINLMKVGVFSLLIPIINPSYYIYYFDPLIEFAIIMVPGTVFSTLVYEREMIVPSRDQAGSLAFLITGLSTLTWWIFRTMGQPTPGYTILAALREPLPESMEFPVLNFVSSEILILVGLVTGLLIIYFNNTRKNLPNHPSNP